MYSTLVIPGKISGQVFVPDEPLPNFESPAELIVYTGLSPRPNPAEPRTVFDFIGKAAEPRSAEELDAQLREEHNSWSDS
jgi:hypothetical protein